MKSCEKKVKDLRLTVELVQNDRAQFAHIDDFELEKRAQYISDMRQELEGMQQYFDGDEVKQKMIADERPTRTRPRTPTSSSTSRPSSA